MDRRSVASQIVDVTALLDQLIRFLELRPWLAYATVFVAALLEAVPVLGSFVPGSSVIIGLSAFVAAGELGLAGVLASAISGAVLGDGTAFMLGYAYRRQVLRAWPLKSYPGIVARSETLFVGRGTLAVPFARFVPPVRAFVPVTAGALAGTLWKQYGRNIEHIVLPVLAIAVGIALVAWFVRWWHALTMR